MVERRHCLLPWVLLIAALTSIVTEVSAYNAEGSGDYDFKDTDNSQPDNGFDEETTVFGSGDSEPTLCQLRANEVQRDAKGDYIPQCTTDGEFIPLQCDMVRDLCWCVDTNGLEIQGTQRSTSVMPDCSKLGIPDVEVEATVPPLSSANDDIIIDEYEGEVPIETTKEAPKDAPSKEFLSISLGNPLILIAIIVGAVLCLVCSILLILFIVYRMRKKDEGTYALEEPWLGKDKKANKNIIYTKTKVHDDAEYYA